MNSPIDPFAPIKKKGRTGADGNEEKCAGRIGEQNRLWTEASPFNLSIGFLSSDDLISMSYLQLNSYWCNSLCNTQQSIGWMGMFQIFMERQTYAQTKQN